MRVRLVWLASGTLDPCTSYTFGETHDYLVNIVPLTPCSAQPTAGTITPASPVSGCPGASYTFSTTGTTIAGSLSYLWMQSTNGGISYTPAAGVNNTPSYTTPAMAVSTRYHLVVTCTPTGQKDSTADVLLNISGPSYAPVPYVQDFESWINGCVTSDIPSNNWTNQPSTGNASWRRDDQGITAAWTSPTSGAFTPAYAVGQHSARFHAYLANANQVGSLSLYVNCSGLTGQPELQLYLRTDPGAAFPNDSLNVYQSNDGGQTFAPTPIAAYGPGNGQWQYHSQLLNVTTATTVFRFDAKASFNSYTDIGLDYVRIVPACAGAPVAGTVNPVTPCANQNFILSLNGSTQASGLTYQWQYLNSANVWTAITPGNASTITYNISQATSVRAIVTCTASSLSDTTAPYLINLASFYYCYCGSNSTLNYSQVAPNIGNVTLQSDTTGPVILTNGIAAPQQNNNTATHSYTDFRSTVAPICLYRDSLYKLSVFQINPSTFSASTATAFIDYNEDGNFSATSPSERLFSQPTSVNIDTARDTFRVPHNAVIGTTGMRVILVNGAGVSINPCGTYGYGETEDYLVNICATPCNGPANPGTALSTDSVVCPGYTIDLADTTHETQRSGLAWVWQSSFNGGVSWNDLAGSAQKDTLNNVLISGPMQFRLRMLCTFTHDTTYSNLINVTNGSNYQCYPVSQSTGNKSQDSSDIGTFSIGSYIMPIGLTAGPHIKNPLAVRHHTDYTQGGWIVLDADSTYPMAIYHTMSSDNHQDARVSVFMDFNNDFQYSALSGVYPYGPEMIYTGVTTQSNYYLSTTVTMPNALVPETPTGLRVVLNNDVNPGAPANLGAGTYISGETEDYVVLFHRYDPTKVGITGLVKDIIMYPNPTEGRFTLCINSAKDIATMDVQVTNLTGQTVMSRSYSHTGTQFTTDLDLSGQARGVYFVVINADGDRITRKLVIR